MKHLKGERLPSQWSWWQFPDESLRARLSAIALRGAKALGCNSEAAWFDKLREADFVKCELTGHSPEKQPDGSRLELRNGSIDDVLKQSITLCHVLETDGGISLLKGSSRGRRAAESGFMKPGPLHPDSPTPVDGGTEENGSGAEHQALKWDDIEISFLSDERVQITVGTQTETVNYAEMGLDNRKNGTPVRAWNTLREMAEARGAIMIASDSRNWAVVEKRIQELRKVLRHRFGITDDPLPYTKKTRRSPEVFGYRTKFRLACGPSYES